MKHLSLTLAVILALACNSLHAETLMLANIPFDFQLGSKVMPAGEYRIKCAPNVLIFDSYSSHAAAMVLTVPKSRSKAPENGLLEFNRYGNTYFFSGAWTPNSANGAGVTKTSREKELVRATHSPQMNGIVASVGR